MRCPRGNVTTLILDRYDLCYSGRGSNHFFLSKEQEKELELLVNTKRKELDGKINVNLVTGPRIWKTKEDIVPCGAFAHSFSVVPNGDIPICEKTSGLPELTVGNVTNQTLAEIWSSPRIQEILTPPPEKYKEPCKSCEFLSICNTGCFAAKRYFEGSQYGPDPKCWKANYDNNLFII